MILSDGRHKGAVGVPVSGSQDVAPEFLGKRPQKFRGIWAPPKKCPTIQRNGGARDRVLVENQENH